jgi:hypothetical protein
MITISQEAEAKMVLFNRKKLLFLLLAVGVFSLGALSSGGSSANGNILGFVYGQDGSTPLEGAVIVAKNLDTGMVYESTKSDELGIFKLPGIEKGIYVYGVKTPQGEFNASSPMGITIGANETAKLSISVTPLEKNVSSAMTTIYEEQKVKGEALIGKVVNYSPENKLSVVYIVKGFLEEGQRIHLKSASTNFYQDVQGIRGTSAGAKRVFSGETGALPLKNRAQAGDEVFLVCKRGHVPLFLAPLGIAMIVAGSAGIVTHVTDVSDETRSVSDFKK